MTTAAHPPPAGSLPFARPRRELLVLVLVALATLTPIYVVSSQDVSRLCLSRALLAGRLSAGPCIGRAVDRARYGGRVYSDKAPGMSVLAVPAVAVTSLRSAGTWRFGRDVRVWAVRVLTGGIAFLLLVFALGRVAEGLAAGSGGPVAVTFAVGTLAGALAATTFDEVMTATLGFGAFLLAWHRWPTRAGLLAGLAVLCEYQAALVLAILALYVAASGGRRRLLQFLAGSLPGLTALGIYDWAAFGSPFHASYRYVANRYAQEQASGFFGISLPRLHSIEMVLAGDRGLLIASPVLVAAAFGLALLARDHWREAATCGAITLCFLLLEFGYFLPYGGISPGPRFFIPALPFLALGLAAAYERHAWVTAALAVPSVIAATALELTWSWGSSLGYRQTIWGELARTAVGADRRIRHDLAGSILTVAHLGIVGSALATGACACLALAVALLGLRRTPEALELADGAAAKLGARTTDAG